MNNFTFKKLDLDGVILFKYKIYSDLRGIFSENYNQSFFNYVIKEKINFTQDNEVESNYGVLRGMHYQQAPFGQSKLVRVIQGKILDIIVDCRNNSDTFGKYISVELNAKDNEQLYIPKGFAHGYLSLGDNTLVEFKVDNKYSPEHIQGFIFNDSTINIDWKINISEIIVSDEDNNLSKFNNLKPYNIDIKKEYN